MKKTFFYAALAVISAGMTFVACSKSNELLPEEKGNKEEVPAEDGLVTIKAGLQSYATRVGAVAPASGTGLDWNWQAGDKITVIGETTESFTIKDGFSAAAAEFEGNPVSGSSFSIVYPGTCTTVNQVYDLDFSSQTQDGNASMAHLRYAAVLKNVNSYEDFVFSSEWAEAHGGSIKQSGVIKFVLTLPAAITGVKKLVAAAPGGAGSIEVNLTNVTLAEGNVLTVYATFPVGSLTVPAGATISLTLTDSSDAVWTKDMTFTAESVLQGGAVNLVKLENPNTWVAPVPARYAGGDGSETDPWQIANPEQLDHMREDLVADETVYYKLIADLDLAAVTDWSPIHPTADTKRFEFDGQNHTIKNFSYTTTTGYPSFFGAINGVVKNLVFKDCTVTVTGNGPAGILAGWAGISTGAFDATVENVHATGCTVSSSNGTNTIGGLVGRVHKAKFINCSFAGTVERTATDASGYKYVGGLVGSDEWAGEYLTTFKQCSTSGTLVTKSGNSAGGILGGTHNAAYVQMEDCHSTMNITTAGTVTGGIQGYTGGGIYTDCSYNGKITNTATGNAFVAGIIPYIFHWATFSNCTSEGEITTPGKLVGGIVGQFNPQDGDTGGSSLTDCKSSMKITSGGNVGGLIGTSANNDRGARRKILRCSASGDVVGNGDWTGGLIGFMRNADIEDCAYYGQVSGSGQRMGGFLGNAGGGNLTLRRCYTGADVVNANLGSGGLIGQAQTDNSTAGTHADIKIIVEKCIAWGTKVVSESGRIDQWGSGAIIGSVAGGNTLTDNYRNPAMTVSYNCANTEWPLVYDQENCSSSSPLKYYNGAAEAPATCQSPYHGKAAASGKTASDVARDLGYSTEVWNLNGSVPVLK